MAGGREGMFKYPYVETLAAKMRASFEQAGNARSVEQQRATPDARGGGRAKHASSNGSSV